MRLKGKKAFITGSGNLKGIGCGIAESMAKEGADIVLHYIDATSGEVLLVKKEMEKYGVNIMMVKGDISDHNQVMEMFQVIEDTWGMVDVVVNNAGVCVWDDFLDVKDMDYKKMVDVNLKGTIDCASEAAKRMVRSSVKGSIINVASCHARRPFPNMAIYGATKGGIDQFSRSLAYELAPYQIRVNQIWPGLILTDINTKDMPELENEESTKKHLETLPLGIISKPDDAGAAAVYFASDESKAVTGECIKIDAGAFIRCLL